MIDSERPNILLLCTDQQRFDALGAAGNPEIHTPNLDRLAGAGARFTQCYVQSPVCAPSRASLMTGRYVHNHGLWANGVALPEGTPVLTEPLAAAGYDCGLVGKYHLAACMKGRTEHAPPGMRVFRWAHDPYRGS
ncbi:MAG TPA: sulfatase-like hydrolase/transferase, partial [Microlunatus sp.]|nr:sulfatase-like hydrolase/transferase [Microlunatus sp.]